MLAWAGRARAPPVTQNIRLVILHGNQRSPINQNKRFAPFAAAIFRHYYCIYDFEEENPKTQQVFLRSLASTTSWGATSSGSFLDDQHAPQHLHYSST